MPNAKPYSAACPGRAPRHDHSNGTSAKRATRPRSAGGKQRPVSTPEPSAAPKRLQLGPAPIAIGADSVGVMPLGAVVAELSFFVREASQREEEEARLTEELVGSAGDDTRRAINPIIGIRVLFFEVFFVVVERGDRSALLEEHVERLFDVVGMQF